MRFGIAIDLSQLEHWHVECIQELLAFGNLDLVVIIECQLNGSERSGLKSHLVHCIYRRLAALSAISELPWSDPSRVRYAEAGFTKSDLRSIELSAPKFIVDFTGRLPFESMPSRPDIWRYTYNRPLAFWEALKNEDTIQAALVKDDGLGGCQILRSGYFKTFQYSFRQVIRQVNRQLLTWPKLAAKALVLDAVPEERVPVPQQRSDAINILQAVQFASNVILGGLGERVRRFGKHEHWNIGFVNSSIGEILKDSHGLAIQWLPRPKGDRFIADPFGVKIGDERYILCEDYTYTSDKGVIAGIQVDELGSIVRQEKVIETEVHMSYPFLLEWGGDVYCIPETHQRREVALYKADVFPWKWSKIKTLVENVAALDSTVFQHQGTWWLLFADEQEGSNHTLYAYHAQDLLGPWQAHALNPIKTDIRSSRPGGTPFFYKGDLYRPAQDCSRTYGGRVVINRILKLSPRAFQEEACSVISPRRDSPYPDGLHTLAHLGDERCLVDGKRMAFQARGFVRTLKQYLKRVH